MPRGTGATVFAGLTLVAGAAFLSNALFNVDGGHRAIKYRRMSGVSKEIYSEGEQLAGPGPLRVGRAARICGFQRAWADGRDHDRNPHQYPLVRDAHHLQRAS